MATEWVVVRHCGGQELTSRFGNIMDEPFRPMNIQGVTAHGNCRKDRNQRNLRVPAV